MSVPAAYIGVIVIWATTPLAIKWSGESVGFLFGVSARMLIGVLLASLLILVLRRPWRWHKRAVLAYMAVALGLYGSMLMVYWGAQFIPSGLISVIFGLTPLFTGVMAWLLLGERSLTPSKLIGMSLGLVGLAIIFGSEEETGVSGSVWMGLAAAVISVLVYSLSTVWVKRLNAQVSALEMTAGGLVIANCLYLLTWVLSGSELPRSVPDKELWSIAYLGVFGSVFGFVMFYYALSRVQASTMALITLITPVLALLLGYFLNAEKVGSLALLGSAMILLGLVLYQGELMRNRCIK
jgi:drug/metabolite transporter (DMT)-like permease